MLQSRAFPVFTSGSLATSGWCAYNYHWGGFGSKWATNTCFPVQSASLWGGWAFIPRRLCPVPCELFTPTSVKYSCASMFGTETCQLHKKKNAQSGREIKEAELGFHTGSDSFSAHTHTHPERATSGNPNFLSSNRKQPPLGTQTPEFVP